MSPPATDPPAAIACHALCKKYADITAVDALDLNIPQGQFFGLLGRNGSGKTTTLHMISSLIRPTGGKLLVNGLDVTRKAARVRRLTGLVFQDSALDRNLSVSENLHFSGALYGLKKVDIQRRIAHLLEIFELGDKRDMPVAALSGGMRRAVDIARGVLHEPRLLLLDEPTTGLDVINRRAIWRYLHRLRGETGMTVILTTHYLEEAVDCDQVVFMRQGRVIGSGEPPRLIRELGHHILEVHSSTPDICGRLLNTDLGPPWSEGERLLYRIRDPDFNLGDIESRLRGHVDSLLLRHPDLNDVYVWMNRPADEAGT